MSCNGRDHDWNCNCGFGRGQGASRRRERVPELDLFVPKVPRRYTKANDQCSFCEAPVFFRALVNGGRAYFEGPGSPWTKHPCLDQDSSKFLGTVADSESNWPQLFDPSTSQAGSGFLALRGRLRGANWTGYLKVQQLQAIGLDVACLQDCFIQVHESSPGVFDLALLTEGLRRFVAEARTTMTNGATPRTALPRRRDGRSKVKTPPVVQPDLLEAAGSVLSIPQT
jgi:hypothetical protein